MGELFYFLPWAFAYYTVGSSIVKVANHFLSNYTSPRFTKNSSSITLILLMFGLSYFSDDTRICMQKLYSFLSQLGTTIRPIQVVTIDLLRCRSVFLFSFIWKTGRDQRFSQSQLKSDIFNNCQSTLPMKCSTLLGVSALYHILSSFKVWRRFIYQWFCTAWKKTLVKLTRT